MALYGQFWMASQSASIFGELEWKMGVSANTLHWQNCACALLRNRWRVCLCLCVCVFITLSKISSVDSAEGSRICSNVRFWATYATIIDTPNSIYMKYVYRNGIKNDPWLIIFYVNSMRDKLKTLVTLTKFNSIVIVQLRESKQEHSNEARCKTSCQQSTICIIQHFVIYSHFKTSHSHHSHHWAHTPIATLNQYRNEILRNHLACSLRRLLLPSVFFYWFEILSGFLFRSHRQWARLKRTNSAHIIRTSIPFNGHI